MAKHKAGKHISKKQRLSCVKLDKQPAKAQVGNNNNAMREAFLNTPFTDAVRNSKLGQAIIGAVLLEPKRTVDQIKGWSAKLSFRTYQQLKAQEIVA